jgi:hypothetical protein
MMNQIVVKLAFENVGTPIRNREEIMKSLKRRKSMQLCYFLLLILLSSALGLTGCGGSGGGGGGGGGGTTGITAENGTLTTDEDTPATGTLSATSADGNALTFRVDTDAAMGTVTITDAATGAYSYTPDANANGSDSFTFIASDGTEDSNTATVDITIVSVNDLPVVEAGDPQTASEFEFVTLLGSVTDVEDGANSSISWTQTGGSTAVLEDADTVSPGFYAPAIGAASEEITFQMSVTDNDGATVADDVVVTVTNTANLDGVVADIPDVVDLEAEGTTDWVHWGLTAADDINRKAGVTNVLGSYTPTDNAPHARRIGGTSQSNEDSRLAVSWTNGDPTPTATVERTGLFFPFPHPIPVGQGFSLSVPADLTTQTLNLYVGVFRGNAKLTATLTGATPIEFDISNEEDTAIVRKVILNFGAETAGDTLNITFAVQDSPQTSNISLHAATLSAAKVAQPVITPPNGLFAGTKAIDITTSTPNATIRYTTDGSEPNAGSQVFTTGDLTLSANTVLRAKAFAGGFAESDGTLGNFTIVDAGNSIKEVSIKKAPDIVNLETEGTLSWAHWGLGAVDDFNRKSGGTDELDDFTEIGTVTAQHIGTHAPFDFEAANFAASWTNGIPDPSANAERTGLFFPFDAGIADAPGIQVVVDTSDTTERILRFYIGSHNGNGKLTTSLNGSADVETIVENPHATPIVKVVEIRYAPSDPADDLTLRYTVENNAGASSITLHAATLSN